MAILTTTAQLEANQTAITAAEGLQEFTLDGIAAKRASLATLYAERRRLTTQLAKENGSRPFMKTINFGGMSY